MGFRPTRYGMHYLFVDYAQAFVSVYGNKIIECLAQFKVVAKLIRLIDLNPVSTRARVKINNEYTKEFKIEVRVK